MTTSEVLALLDANKNERGIAHWERLGVPGMRSFGIGVTQLRKFSKQIGRDHSLFSELWMLPVYDVKILATLIADPKQLSNEQIDVQIPEAKHWLLSHSYCSNLLAKSPFALEKAVEWCAATDHLLRRCGYLLLYHLAKDDRSLPDDFFLPYLDNILNNLQDEENFVKDAMNNALVMIGQRNPKLHKTALEIAMKIGKVQVDYGDNACQAIDCVAHLTGERVLNKVEFNK